MMEQGKVLVCRVNAKILMSPVAGLLVLLLLLASGANAENRKHAWDCMKVELTRASATHYRAQALNTCDQALETVVVLVKFFDRNWNRIGVGAFTANYVAGRERIKVAFPAPPNVWGLFEHVGVRAIKEDPIEALK